MATTTTITASSDNWLNSANVTTNYGSATNFTTGITGAVATRNTVLEFDVSSLTNVADITSATMTLTAYGSGGGGGTNNMTLQRLTQSFGETTSNWNTYDGTNGWTTAGAFDDVVSGETTYTVEVGTTTDIVVDIKELVIDAVNRRSGTLRIIIYYDGTPSSGGFTRFRSRNYATSADRPTLEVVTADRIVWDGIQDGDLSNGNNWSGLTGAPTTNDIALFVTNGAFAPNTGTVTCSHCYFGKQFSSDVGSSARSIDIVADKVFVDTKAQLYLNVSADEVRIRGAKRIVDGCVIRGTVADVYIMGCESEVRVDRKSVV